MKISIDKEFTSREELDSFVLSRLGDNQEENIKHELEITPEESQKLAIDADTKVFGVRVLVKEVLDAVIK